MPYSSGIHSEQQDTSNFPDVASPLGEQNQWEELERPSIGAASELLYIVCLGSSHEWFGCCQCREGPSLNFCPKLPSSNSCLFGPLWSDRSIVAWVSVSRRSRCSTSTFWVRAHQQWESLPEVVWNHQLCSHFCLERVSCGCLSFGGVDLRYPDEGEKNDVKQERNLWNYFISSGGCSCSLLLLLQVALHLHLTCSVRCFVIHISLGIDSSFWCHLQLIHSFGRLGNRLRPTRKSKAPAQ